MAVVSVPLTTQHPLAAKVGTKSAGRSSLSAGLVHLLTKKIGVCLFDAP
jgi:hypothetical protein